MADVLPLQQRVGPTVSTPNRVGRDAFQSANPAAALSQVAGAASQVALTVDRKEQERLERDRQSKLGALRNQHRQQSTLGLLDDLQAARTNAQPGADGFYDGFKETVARRRQDALAMAGDDQAARQLIEQDFDQLSLSFLKDAQEFQAVERVKHRADVLDGSLNALGNAIVASPDQFRAYYDQGLASIDAASTDLSPDGRRKALDDWKNSASLAAFNGMLEADPYQALEDAESKRFDSLWSPEIKARAINSAQSEIKRREAEARAQQAAREKIIAGRVEDALYVLDRGHLPPNIGDIQSMVSEYPEMKAVVDSAIEGVHEVAEFSRLPVAARREILRQAASNGTPTKADLLREQRLAKRSAEIDRLLEDDPISAAIETGIVGSPPPLAENITARRDIADIVEQAYGVESSGLLKEETLQFARDMQDMSTPEKMQQLQMMRDGLGDRRMRLALGDIAEDDPTTAAAVAISIDNPSLASEVFEGQKVIKAIGRDILPPATGVEGYNTLANDALGDVLEFARPEDREAMVQSALAVEAARRNKLGLLTKEDFSPEVFQEILTNVVGGVVSYNDEKIIPPAPDLDEDGFEDVMGAITDEDLPLIGGPFLDRDGNAVEWETIQRHGHLKSFGHGQYFVFLGDRPLAGQDGGPAELGFGAHLDVIRSRLDMQRRRGFLSRFGLGGSSE